MNAEEHDNLMRAIERDEAWLAAAMQRYPHPPCRALRDVKQRLHAELQAASWIDAGLPPAGQAVKAAKAAVWGELLRTAAADPPAPPRRAGWWWRNRVAVATLASAAALALIVFPMVRSAPPGNRTEVALEGRSTHPGFGDAVAALTLSITDDFDTEVAAVAADIDDFYDTITLANDEDLDTEFDDIDADLDSLAEEFDSLGAA